MAPICSNTLHVDDFFLFLEKKFFSIFLNTLVYVTLTFSKSERCDA